MTQQSDLRLRREAMQRVQIGLVGFVVVLLVVALANIVVTAIKADADPAMIAQQGDGVAGVANTTAMPENNEPFADLGVTPKSDAVEASPAAPSVPDLQPDPRLSRPMDQDPKPASGR